MPPTKKAISRKPRITKVGVAAKAFDAQGRRFDTCVEKRCPPIALPSGELITDHKSARCAAIRCVKESAALARSLAEFKRAIAKQRRF